MFHHAKWYAKVKYDPLITEMIKSLKTTAREHGDFNKRSQIADFVEHLHKEFLNPSQDWAQLRTINALWHLGAVPASAVVNLTQMVAMSMPFLGTKFGDLKSMSAFMRVGKELSTHYRRGNLEGANQWELEAIALAVDEQ